MMNLKNADLALKKGFFKSEISKKNNFPEKVEWQKRKNIKQ